ncbi:MAG TPA: TolC family protein, partial [Gemmatimonadales bacterium]|nr:TolC family protein [Gemmatimonadales bacterium]
GRAPGPIPRTGAPGDQLLAAVPAGLPSALVTRRPDVRAAERELAAVGADVGAARAQLLPQLDLSADVRWIKEPGFSTTIMGFVQSTPGLTERTWELTASITQPLFMGGSLVAGLHAAESRRRQAEIAYEGTVLSALADAETQLAALRFAGERRASADSQAVYAAAALAAAEARYAAGTAPFLEVVDAQRTHLAAALGAVNARARQADAIIGLYKALGGGWQDDSTGTTEGQPR